MSLGGTRVTTIGAFFVFANLASSGAHAIENKDVAKCAAMQNSVNRLACFDEIASENKLAPKQVDTTATDSGKWRTSKDVDPLNDKDVYYAILLADSGNGKFGDRIGLVARCAAGKTELYINWMSYLGMDSTRTTIRVDKNPAQTSNWSVSTNKKAAFFPQSPIPLLKQIASSQVFVANVTPYNENSITATFDTKGANVALHDMRQACKW